MKNIYTFLIISLLFSSTLYGWDKGSFMKPDFITNPYNDEEIVFTGSTISLEFNICKVDFITGKSVLQKLTFQSSSGIKDVIINGDSKRIGYLSDGKIEIFNYNDFTKIANFPLNYSGDSQETKVCFSKDGSKIYTLKKSELRLSVYDVSIGTKSDEILINANPTFYSAAYLNSEKDEFALVKSDSLEIWSISSGSMDRKIPFDIQAESVQFRNSGNNISYKVGKEIHVVNSLTGAEIYSRTLPFDIHYLEFSANMKYMICRAELFKQSVWDIDADTLIFEGTAPFQLDMEPNFVYINSNKTKAVGFDEESMYCGRYMEDVYTEAVYYLYDMPSYKKINSVANAFVGNPVHAIINPTNELILVSSLKGEYNVPKYNHGLLTENGEFLKFIHVNRPTISFSHDSKYIAFDDTTSVLLYNIESGEIEKTLQSSRNTIGKVFFSPQAGGLIISITKDFIDVYDYNTLNLNFSKELTPESGDDYGFVCDITGKITILYPSGRYFDFDAVTGDLTEITLNNLPENRTFREMTNDGRYILWSFGKDSINVYDVKLQNVKFTFKIELMAGYAEKLSIGFLGNHEIVWFSYISNPIDKFNTFFAYDLVEEKQVSLDGEGTPRISIDGTKYITLYCPYEYSYNSIRLPVSVYESKLSEADLKIHPNPATEYITIQISEVFKTSEVSDIKIYNMLGECVIELTDVQHLGDVGHLQRIDASHLPRGMYYLCIGNRTQMFVKV